MTTAQLRTQWCRALSLGHCVEVMRLLKEEPSLVLEGWKADPSRWHNGDPFDGEPNRQPWLGRTALHVGAERGCVDLIKKVLLLFNLEAVRNYGILEEQDTGATQSRDEIVATPGQSDPVESNGVERSGGTIVSDGMVLEGDDQKATSVHGRPRRPFNNIAVSTIIDLNRKKKDAANLPRVQSKSDPLDRKAVKEEEIRSEETSAVLGSSKHSINVEIGENDVDNLGYSVTRVNLRELLLSKDGTVGLEALAMAGIHYNQDIVNLLIYALEECDNPPYWINYEGTLSSYVSHDKKIADGLDSLRKTVEEFIASPESEFSWIFKAYDSDCNLNFLPLEAYFFHFLSGSQIWEHDERQVRLALTGLRKRLLEGSLWKFVLELKDGQGRTPFNVAVANRAGHEFLAWFTDGNREMVICALTAPDRAGRSPLHRAACSSSAAHDVSVILRYCEEYEEVLATCHTTWVPRLGRVWTLYNRDRVTTAESHLGAVLSSMSMSYGYSSDTHGFKPLHAAIIHGEYENAKSLIEKYARLGCLKDSWYFIEYDFINKPNHFENLERGYIAWGLIEFALLVEADMKFVQHLLKEWPSLSKLVLEGDNCSTYDLKTNILQVLHPDWLSPDSENNVIKELELLKDPWEAVHIAASAGNYEMLRLFTDNSQYDPLIEDFEGNNGLHHAMNVRPFRNIPKHIFDFVTLRSFEDELYEQKQSLEDGQLKDQKDAKKSKIVEREGCINLLLKVGCDIFKYNKKKQVPDPQGDLIKEGEFCSWWYDKQEKEVGAIQDKLHDASNAISVVAALVATASYLGPLTPPLGYVADPTNQIQDDNVWVEIFVFFDTFSFYLAIIAITFALIPSIPVWQQPVIEEVRKTKVMVTVAVSFLLPSIASVLVAFASSSMAVVSARLISSAGGILTIVSLSICAPVMIVAFSLFSVRLLGSLFPRRRWVSGMYKRCI